MVVLIGYAVAMGCIFGAYIIHGVNIGVILHALPTELMAILGGMIGSALVGTFLGILLAYAVVEPLGGLIEQKVDEGSKELQCIKTTLLASMQGYAPQVAVEFGRKVLYSKDRPTFSELEGHVKGKK